MWMSRELVTITPEAPVSFAVVAMSRHKVRRLLVAHETLEGPHLVGIVTSADVMRAFPADVNPFSSRAGEVKLTHQVVDVMTRPARTVVPDTPIEEAARLMRRHKIGALPVVEGPRLVGIITESDVFRAFIEVIGVEARGVRVTFELGEDEDAIATVLLIAKRHNMRVASFFSLHHSDARDLTERRLGVVRLVGDASEAVVEAIWRSGHRVVSVLPLSPDPSAAR